MTDGHTPVTRRPRQLPFVFLGLLVLAAAIALSIYWIKQVEPPKPRPPQKNITVVTLQPVITGEHSPIFFAGGFVSAQFSSRLAAQVNGVVKTVSPTFAVGKKVQKGETLATIDDKDYLAALAVAKAHLAETQSRYAQEQAQARQAAGDAKRLGVKGSDLLLRKPQLNAAKAAVANAQAQQMLAEKNLAKTIIKAPFDALIETRQIAPGDSVGGNSIVAQLIAVERFSVKLNVDSHLFNLLSLGNSVTLHNPDNGASYRTTIRRFSPTLDKNSRTVGIYADIDQPLAAEKPLLLNTYLHAHIVGKSQPNSVWIANHATVDNRFVWIKKADNSLEKQDFTLIYRDKSRSLVRFEQPVSHYISNPKDDFFIGEKVTTQAPEKQPSDNRKAGGAKDE